MADALRRLADHVHLFNDAVRSGDWAAFLATFHEDAVMRFAGVPVGPFHGRDEIAKAYAEQPPDDTITVSRADIAGDTVTARVTWSASRAPGLMRLTLREGKVAELFVSFLPADWQQYEP